MELSLSQCRGSQLSLKYSESISAQVREEVGETHPVSPGETLSVKYLLLIYKLSICP